MFFNIYIYIYSVHSIIDSRIKEQITVKKLFDVQRITYEAMPRNTAHTPIFVALDD